MFSSSLLAFAIAALTVQAAIVPARVRDVPDAVVDIVLTIECTPLELPGTTGSLVINSNSGINLPLALTNNVLQEDNVADGERQAFVFENCTSTFMNLTTSATTYYGHITPASNSSACLSSRPGLTTPQNITTEPCSISDDSGQMLQFWKLSLGTSEPYTPTQIDFVGQPTSLNTGKYYITDFTGVDGSRVAQINRVDDSSHEAPYEITLVPILS